MAATPFGISKQAGGINFSLAALHADTVTLCLFDPSTKECVSEHLLSAIENKTGDVWHITLPNVDETLLYAYKITPKFGKDQYLILDPYAKEVATGTVWGENRDYLPLGNILTDLPFDWSHDIRPNIPVNKLIIYEMHARGLTIDPSSKVKHRGSFLGIIEKIPHLLDLGINAIELLPIQEFNEMEYLHSHKDQSLLSPSFQRYNYFGYSTVNFFSPMKRYATSISPGSAIHEFKTMVKALHQHGIEVILDVVFNHTGEGGETGPIFSFKALNNGAYYILDKSGQYFNFSGCGNSFNANHPITMELIINSLRYFASEMHVDGFRFDLSSALTRGTDGNPLENAPLIEAITLDPILKNTKLIAEPWDASGMYQVGNFASETTRWSEWNGKYRDHVRRFIKGTSCSQNAFATSICGSQDLYHNRKPYTSINFITAHDGFTLTDLVSYNKKHNLSNGEDNKDGTNDNESWNCGIEGETNEEIINQLRERQKRNFHLALMISQGVPMIHMGDEYGHTKKGNNNTWCHDSPLNWFLWDELKKNEVFYSFYKKLIHFRKNHPIFSQTKFLEPEDISWHGILPFQPSWHSDTQFVAFTIKSIEEDVLFYVAFNASQDPVTITIPTPPECKCWKCVVNTADPSMDDVLIDKEIYKIESYSSILLQTFNLK